MLRGEKVILRPVEREDMKRMHELEQHTELAIWGGGDWEPKPLGSFEKDFDRYLDPHEPSRFVIEVDGKVIGGLGLHGRRRRVGVTEFGIGIYDPDYISKGYGRDAVNTMLAWAFRMQNWRRVWLNTFSTNERALRSYLASGFVEEGRLREHEYVNGGYVDLVMMGILREEWERRQAAS